MMTLNHDKFAILTGDGLCSFPGLLEGIWRPPMTGVGLQVYINAYNTIWVFVFACVIYAVVRVCSCHYGVGGDRCQQCRGGGGVP
jgi:hypothetical protein